MLYSFCGAKNCTDGLAPHAGLLLDAEGNLYSTTLFGGANPGPSGDGGGTVFKIAGAVGGLGTATVSLTSSPNPSTLGQSVTFSAVVAGGGATPTGTVTFKEGTTVLGTTTLANGQASLTTTFTKSGTFSIVANYSGDNNYKAAKSKPLKQVVEK